MFIQFELHTTNNQFEIFWVGKPVEVNAVDTKPVVVGLLTSNEEEMLNIVESRIIQCQCQLQQTPKVDKQVPVLAVRMNWTEQT